VYFSEKGFDPLVTICPVSHNTFC